jgi:hypothetical protein
MSYVLAQMWKVLDLREWEERYGRHPEIEIFEGLREASDLIPRWVDSRTDCGNLNQASLNKAVHKAVRFFIVSPCYPQRLYSEFVNAYEEAEASRRDLP